MKNKDKFYNNSIYSLPMKEITTITIISFALMILFFIMFVLTHSIIYFLFFLPSLVCFILFFYPFIVNQSVQIIDDNKIIFTYRFGLKYEGFITDSLYKIIVKNGEYEHFRFMIDKRSIQMSPLGYENGEELLLRLKNILNNKDIKVEIISK